MVYRIHYGVCKSAGLEPNAVIVKTPEGLKCANHDYDDALTTILPHN